jgi:NADH-quinone oxidoreductase subunit G
MAPARIKLKIDGVEVEVEKGRTILEAAQGAGIRIPTLCHDRRLVPFGACRLCVVQQKGKSELLPACFTPAKAGMEIITHSPPIVDSRKLQLQFILLNHPMICPRCEKEGECALQALVYEYGVEETLYPWDRTSFPVDDQSPLLQRDPDKCILCGRCVRICDEVQGVGELSFAKRGIKTLIDTDFHRPLNCEFCGQCLDTCPVGAITSDCFDYATKGWELTETTTPCPYCGCGCLLTFGSKEGEIKRVFSDPEQGPNDGNLCVKGRFGWDVIDHPDRILSPLLRVNGSFREASWDEAFSFVAQHLEAIKEKHGPGAIAGMASSRLTNEEYYLFQKLFRTALGTDQIDHEGGQNKALTRGLAETLGMAASTNSIKEIREADCILVVGADPAQTHPIIKNEIHLAIRHNRAQLIVLGPQDIGLTRATQVSPLSPPAIVLLEKPGREVDLLNAMAAAVLKEGLEDKGFVEEKTEGIENLRMKLDLLQTEGGWSFSENKRVDIDNAARAFARAKKAMILIGSAPGSISEPREVALACSNLALTTGHVGKPGSGILILSGKCNSQGAIDLGIFPKGENRGITGLFQKVEQGKVKALYAVGQDPVTTQPALGQASGQDPGQIKKNLENLQLLVVQDSFMTETAKLAHVVLPASSFAEKTGTYTNLERRVQKSHALRPPLGNSKPDFDIFVGLLKLLECSLPGETTEAVFEEIGRFNPRYQGIRDGEQWPKGSTFLYSDGFPAGKGKLMPAGGRAAQGPIDGIEGYPLQLIHRASLFQSGLLSLKSDALNRVLEKPRLEIHPEDGERFNIEEGEMIHVSVPGGRSVRMEVKHNPRLVQGVVAVPFPCALIDDSGMAWVKIEKVREKIRVQGPACRQGIQGVE